VPGDGGGKNLGRIVRWPRLHTRHVIRRLALPSALVMNSDARKTDSMEPDGIPDIQLAASGRHSSKVCARCKKRKTKVCAVTPERRSPS
jgi:hypothetical protein